MADAVLDFSAWVQAAGAAGVVVFMAAYVLGSVVLVPGSVLTLAAGFVWGPVWGTAVVVPASLGGACLAFLVGRSALRPRLERRLARHPKLAAFDRGLGDGGLLVVVLLRLSPLVPFVAANYGLSSTRLAFRDFFVGSLVGMFPGTLAYVYAGSLVTELASVASRGISDNSAGRALFWIGLVATVALTVVLTRVARQALERQLDATP